MSATTGTGTRRGPWTSPPTSSTRGMALRMTPGLRLRLCRRIRLLRRSLYRRIAPRGRRSWPRRGAAGSSRRSRQDASSARHLLRGGRGPRARVGTEVIIRRGPRGQLVAYWTIGSVTARPSGGVIVKAVRPYLIPGAVRRIGDVESPRRAHRVGEFDARAVAESYTAVVEVARTGTAHHEDRLRRAGQRRRAAARVAPRTRIVDEALRIGAGQGDRGR